LLEYSVSYTGYGRVPGSFSTATLCNERRARGATLQLRGEGMVPGVDAGDARMAGSTVPGCRVNCSPDVAVAVRARVWRRLVGVSRPMS